MIIMSKAQADIISTVLIVIIAIGLVSSTYLWGLPLIQKRQDAALAERVSNYFTQKENSLSSLPNLIEYVANTGSEETFSLDVNGLWVLDQNQNSITFTFFSRASVIGSTDWMSLTTGATCPPSPGTIGPDKPSVVCARADTLADGYNVTYKVWYRQLNESSGTRGYKILLTLHSGATESTGKYVRIFRDSITYCSPPDPMCAGSGLQTLIITKIKILFG